MKLRRLPIEPDSFIPPTARSPHRPMRMPLQMRSRVSSQPPPQSSLHENAQPSNVKPVQLACPCMLAAF